jgi:hypothetical protein
VDLLNQHVVQDRLDEVSKAGGRCRKTHHRHTGERKTCSMGPSQG